MRFPIYFINFIIFSVLMLNSMFDKKTELMLICWVSAIMCLGIHDILKKLDEKNKKD